LQFHVHDVVFCVELAGAGSQVCKQVSGFCTEFTGGVLHCHEQFVADIPELV
jgi:hypothetical protein